MAKKREKAINHKIERFHETSLHISFFSDALKVAGFCKKEYFAIVDKSV
jgi:hypothetical protein